MRLCRWAPGVAMVLMLVTAGSNRSLAAENTAAENAGEAAAAQKDKEAVFKLRAVSVLAQADRFTAMPNPMIGGSTVMVSQNRFKEVRAYPQLNSKRPLYGQLLLSGDPAKRTAAKTFYFVLDESAPRAEADEKADKSAQGKAGKTAEKAGEMKGLRPLMKIRPKPLDFSRYDRLYFDSDGCGDLTHDAPIALMEKVPAGLERFGVSRVFETVSLSLGEGGEGEAKAVRLMPMMSAWGGGEITFLPATEFFGRIRLGPQVFNVTLIPTLGKIGRLDEATTPLYVNPIGVSRWTSSAPQPDQLGTVREVNGEYYKITATPAGDQLTVRPYPGERGVFEVRKGNRNIPDTELGVSGQFGSKDGMFFLGRVPAHAAIAAEKGPTRAKYYLPAGEYQPWRLLVDFGPLSLQLRMDNMPPSDPARKADANAIVIRKDKPYVLDFSAKPQIVFLDLPKTKQWHPGDAVRIQSRMIVDPEKRLYLVSLNDKTKTVVQSGRRLPNFRGIVPSKYAAIEPTLVITDAAGKTVASGAMRLGINGACGYSWQVPNDLQISGDKATFTATVTYETGVLFGKVEEKQAIEVVKAPVKK